jgi:glutaredoxin-related protein
MLFISFSSILPGSVSATETSLLFLKGTKHIPKSGFFHWLKPWPEMFLIQKFARLAPHFI